MTGEDAQGRSTILSDGPAPNHFMADYAPSFVQVLWATGESAAEGQEPAPAGHKFGFHSPKGSILRIVDFPPDDTYTRKDRLTDFLDTHGVRDENAPRHFWFHKTESLDYAICLSGEIHALLDEDETVMTAGDVLIQRATNQSWSNRSDAPCRMAFVLMALDEDGSV
ncbi:cupin domain-containing protein [Salipiger sp. IMCC34102]|uniref:cupin domain-containing protein n=1 Tax=Salipiger sp. IMCC34102 TaxID=2510647 RepID=UPI001A917C04|nr:cupin domain-containing protein [Salipiger sp. IMCC34102]